MGNYQRSVGIYGGTKMKIAIDPGKSGAIAISQGGKTWTHNCPGTQREIWDLLDELAAYCKIEEVKAIIEKVHSMPGQGVKSVWTFSANYASWQMALIACDIPFEEVSPQSWMKKLGGLPSDKKARKNAIKDKMQKLYPKLKVTLSNSDALALLSVF